VSGPEPFRVAIPDEQVAALRARLAATRWADDFANDDWLFGVERGWLRDMAHYWAEDHDWRATEARINTYPAFRVTIDGIPIHFQHIRGKSRGGSPPPMPLILSHGWPWTFWDWEPLIGPLTDPAAHGGDPGDAFDLVIPSMPGFAFSTPLRRPDVGIMRIASLWRALMQDVLGYARFASAGGDMGALVSAELGHAHAEALIGIHQTMAILPGASPRFVTAEDFAPDEQWMAERMAAIHPQTISHSVTHANDPQTLAYALEDSPIGLAAWIWERRASWSDGGADPATLFGRDFLCDTASIFWFTRSIGTSMRFYKAHFTAGWPVRHDGRTVQVPTGFAAGPKELLYLPRRWMEERTDLRRWTILPRGGHFLPREQPEALIGEYRAFFAPLR
jgi:pimeloyl-ACP methyl ester carboxylesterase